VNYEYSSCLIGEYYTFNECAENEICCFPETDIPAIPALKPGTKSSYTVYMYISVVNISVLL